MIASDVCGLPEKVLQKQQDEETAMQADMKAREPFRGLSGLWGRR